MANSTIPYLCIVTNSRDLLSTFSTHVQLKIGLVSPAMVPPYHDDGAANMGFLPLYQCVLGHWGEGLVCAGSGRNTEMELELGAGAIQNVAVFSVPSSLRFLITRLLLSFSPSAARHDAVSGLRLGRLSRLSSRICIQLSL